MIIERVKHENHNHNEIRNDIIIILCIDIALFKFCRDKTKVYFGNLPGNAIIFKRRF